MCDTKTTTYPLTDYYFRNYENALPVSLYFYTVLEILGCCDSVQIDGISIPYPPDKSVRVPFARRTFMRTEFQIEDAVNTYCRVTDYLLAGVKKDLPLGELLKHFYCNQSMCNDYGGCPFKPLCCYGFTHPSLLADMKANNPVGEALLLAAQNEDQNSILELRLN